MKILTYTLAPVSSNQGLGNVILNVSKEMKAENTLFTLGKNHKLWFYSFLSPIKFAFFAKKYSPDIVFVHTTEASFDPVIAKKLFGFNYKIVCVAHGLYSDMYSAYIEEVKKGNTGFRLPFFLNLKISSFRSNAVKNCDQILAVSTMVKNRIKSVYGANSIVVPNGVNVSKNNSKGSISKKPSKIIFVGNQYWLKGLHYLVLANNSLIEPLQIVAVGLDDNQEKEIKKRVDCKNVDFRGIITREALTKEYLKADFLAVPSVYESFGLVYIEALSNGLPIIASLGTGAEDIVSDGKNGILVKKGDVFGLKDALNKMITNYSHYKKNAYLDKDYSWANISKKYSDVLKEVMKK